MNILVDIVHPADVLFFFNPIRKWQQMGHSVAVVSRRRDVTRELLDALAIDHQVISTAGSNLFGLGLELIGRDLALLKVARKFKPDVMCGFGGVAISHVGKVLGIPAISFYDTERAPLQHRVTLPFITHLYVPESYDGPVAKNRTSRFPGTKDFSYLHPDNFKPDRSRALAAGLDPGASNYFLRFVGWQANHDIGRKSWQEATLRQFVDYLSARGKVHLSSELPVPQDLHKHRYAGSVKDAHHLLAFCQCYIGESATMAGEAALLGVPAVYATDDRRCYIDALEASGMVWTIARVQIDTLCETVKEIADLDQGEWRQRLAKYMSDKINLADFVVEMTLKHGEPAR